MQVIEEIDSLENPEMATTKERFDGIDGRLNAVDHKLGVIEEALGIAPKRPGLLTRKWAWIKQHHKTIIPVAALILLIPGWFISAWVRYWFDHRYDYIKNIVADTLSQKGGVNDNLHTLQQQTSEMKGTLDALRPYIQDAIKHEWDHASALPTSQLQNHLPALAHLATAAREQQIRIDPLKLTDVSQKLLSMRRRPDDFWYASAALITLRSFDSAPEQLKTIDPTVLPNCTDDEPSPMSVADQPAPNQIHLAYGHYDNCRLEIDSPTEDSKLNSYLEHTPLLKFNRCVITYRGGDIQIKAVWRELAERVNHTHYDSSEDHGVIFEDCIFIVPIHKTPPLTGQRVVESLLAQNGPTISFLSSQ
jgi:hypothetical protein